MALTSKQKKQLRALGHSLQPVVAVGNSGLTEGVRKELALSLEHHELLKIKVSCGDRDERSGLIEQICGSTDAELVQSIGRIALIYRARKKNPGIQLDP